jgi:hypothetical protein
LEPSQASFKTTLLKIPLTIFIKPKTGFLKKFESLIKEFNTKELAEVYRRFKSKVGPTKVFSFIRGLYE